MKKRSIGIGVGLLMVAVMFGAGLTIANNYQLPTIDEATIIDNGEEMTPNAHYRVSKNGELVAKGHNALMEGESIIRAKLTNSSLAWECDTIALGNGTSPGDSSASLASEISSGGLGPATGTYEYIGSGTDGVEWNISNEFSSSVTTTVNTTAVKCPSASSSNDYLNGFGFGRDVNVISGDNISVEVNFDPD